jgi:hypothetical protein
MVALCAASLCWAVLQITSYTKVFHNSKRHSKGSVDKSKINGKLLTIVAKRMFLLRLLHITQDRIYILEYIPTLSSVGSTHLTLYGSLLVVEGTCLYNKRMHPTLNLNPTVAWLLLYAPTFHHLSHLCYLIPPASCCKYSQKSSDLCVRMPEPSVLQEK